MPAEGHRYNEEGVEGLKTRPIPGRAPYLTEQQMAELYDLVVKGPNLATDKVVRWRCVDLLAVVKCRFSIEVHESTIGKWLHQLRLTRLQPRPVHPKKNPEAEVAFKKRGRIGVPPVAVETDLAIMTWGRPQDWRKNEPTTSRHHLWPGHLPHSYRWARSNPGCASPSNEHNPQR
jgi:transposase